MLVSRITTGVLSARLVGDQVHKGPDLRVGGSDVNGWEYPSRTVVVDGRLWVLTDSSLRAVDLTTLEEQASVRL